MQQALAWCLAGRRLMTLGIAALLLGSWLSMARFDSGGEAPLEILVIDTSASTRLGNAEAGEWLQDQVQGWLDDQDTAFGIAGAGPDLLVVTFGPTASTLTAPGKLPLVRNSLNRFLSTAPLAPRDSGSATHQASPLDAALALVEGELKGHSSAGVTLLGDGSYSGMDPLPRLEAWAAAGVRIELISPPVDRADLALSDLIVSPRIFAGGSLVAGLTVTALAPTAAPGAPSLRVRASFGGMAGDWYEPLGKLGPGHHVRVDLSRAFRSLFEQRVEGELNFEISVGFLVNGQFESDAFASNNKLSGVCLVGEPGRILVAVGDDMRARAKTYFLGAESPDALAGQASQNGLVFRFVRPDEVAGALAQTDALVSFELSPDDLPADLVTSFVEAGGGWFAMGGWGFLADRNVHIGLGPRGLLPLGLDQDEPLRHVILMVDGSGSMKGEPFEVVRRGALELVKAAPATDEVRLVFFTNALGVEVRIRPAFAGDDGGVPAVELLRRAKEAENDLAALMTTRVPGGNTHVVGSLDEFVSRRGRSLEKSLILLLTDGQETRLRKDDPIEPSRQRHAAQLISMELSEVRSRLVVIGVGVMEAGSDADRFLRALLQPGETVVSCGLEQGDEILLGELLRQEVNRERVLEGGVEILRAGGEDGFVELLFPMPERSELPPVHRMGRYEVRNGATVLALASSGEPLLAARRLRLGRTAALATLPGSDWAPAWRSAEPMNALLTWLADGPVALGPRVQVTEGSGAKFILEGMPSGDLEGFDLKVRPVVLGSQGNYSPAQNGEPIAAFHVSLMAGPPGLGDEAIEAASMGAALRYAAPVPGPVADALAAGEVLEVSVLNPVRGAADPILAILPLGSGREQGEGHPRRPRLQGGHFGSNQVPGLAGNPGHLDSLASSPSSRGGQPHPQSTWVLLAGLALVFAGGLKAFGQPGR